MLCNIIGIMLKKCTKHRQPFNGLFSRTSW